MRLFKKHNFLIILVILLTLFIFGCASQEKIIEDETKADMVVDGNPIEWAKDAVWYQIFPERFRNGDPSNDPKATDSPETAVIDGWHISSWTADWYELSDYEKAKSSNFYDNVFDRRYGGDFQGVIDKLDYIKELGITAIYFNPIFESPSLHKYDASSWHHIDDNFGPDPDGDKAIVALETADPSTWKWTSADLLFLKFLSEAHSRGMRVIIDGVFNHVGNTFWAFEDVIKNQQKSPYANWFIVTKWDDPVTDAFEFDYEGWWGVKTLPLVNENEMGPVSGPREYTFKITERWMDPNGDGDPSDGVDGWRLDVATDVSVEFWKEWRSLVKGINLEAYIVGEIWSDASTWLQGDQFDAVMNYLFAYAVVDFFLDDATRISATEFDNKLAEARNLYTMETNFVLQNLLDGHDTDRLFSIAVNPDLDYDRENIPRHNENYLVRKPNADEFASAKLATLFQLTYLGAPMIYHGNEAGMWGADDPDDRKPMMWEDMTFDVEKSHPLPGKTRQPDEVKFDPEMYKYFQKLISIRNNNIALRRGNYKTLITNDEKSIYGFERNYKGTSVVVILNNGNEKSILSVNINHGDGNLVDLMTGEVFELKNGVLELSLDSKQGRILKENIK